MKFVVTIEQPVQISANTWRVSWSSDQSDPTFYVYRDGELLGETERTWWDFTLVPGESLMVQVLDDAAADPSDVTDGRVTLAWYGVADTDYYRIDQRAG